MVAVFARLMDEESLEPLALLGTLPVSGEENVSRSPVFRMEFNQDVVLGEGSAWLHRNGHSPLQAARIWLAGRAVEISFEMDFEYGARYSISVDSGAVQGWYGISEEEWFFQIEGQPVVVVPSDLPPPATHCVPPKGTTGVKTGTDGILRCWVFVPTTSAYSLSLGSEILLVGESTTISAGSSLSWEFAQLPTESGLVRGTRFRFEFRAGLVSSEGYGIRIPAGVIMLDPESPWGGVSETEWYFTAAEGILQAASFVPAPVNFNAPFDRVGLSPVFEVTFNKPIRINPEYRGGLALWRGRTFDRAISPSDPSVTVSGNKLSWQFPVPLALDTDYWVEITGPVVEDLDGYPWDGVAKGNWIFRTVATDPSVLQAIAWDAPTGVWTTRAIAVQFNRPVSLTATSSSDSPPGAAKAILRLDGLVFAARATLSLVNSTTLRVHWDEPTEEWGSNPADLQVHDFVATLVGNLILDAESGLPWVGMQWRFSAMFQ